VHVLAVAFFRNLNLGHRGSPTGAQLVAAFDRAGAGDARSFQTNGTVVFDAAAPTAVARAAAAALPAECGWDDLVVVRRRAWLLDLALRLADVPPSTEFTLYDSPADFPAELPWRPPRGRITVVAADRRHLVGVNDAPHTAFGTPTAERLLGVRATSRAATTMVRLAARLR
jgi:hypothetical protein